MASHSRSAAASVLGGKNSNDRLTSGKGAPSQTGSIGTTCSIGR
jgi:hypothetical protein